MSVSKYEFDIHGVINAFGKNEVLERIAKSNLKNAINYFEKLKHADKGSIYIWLKNIENNNAIGVESFSIEKEINKYMVCLCEVVENGDSNTRCIENTRAKSGVTDAFGEVWDNIFLLDKEDEELILSALVELFETGNVSNNLMD